MDTKTISRKTDEIDPDSFESLLREGLSFVQQLSGDHWTDYNLHDPGVTILEHLCFALTDLIYRTKFPLEDYITSKEGTIDWRGLALHPPQTILTSRPTTTTDIRAGIFDKVEGADNVWIVESRNGLHTLAVRIAPDSPQPATVVHEVRKAFHANRNLCEDILDVFVLQEMDYELIAAIEVRSDVEPSEILAQIYYESARHVAATVSAQPYQDVLRSGGNFDEIFDGPLALHGAPRADELNIRIDEDRTDLFSVIRNIAGVEQIRAANLRAVDGPMPTMDPRQNKLQRRLRIPKRQEDLKVSVFRGSSVLPVSLSAVLAGYNKLAFREKSLRHAIHDPGVYISMPVGEHRNLQQYASIQKEFPAIYGINAYGLPESAPPQEHARALQLKAYLLLFEQIMANFLANLQNVETLFSVHGTAKSYVSQLLDDSVIPNIDRVYGGSEGKWVADTLMMYEYDRQKFADRKSRLLDYQLALYGDTLTQSSLRQFDCYHHDKDRDSTVIENKKALLEDIAAINRDRASGFNIAAPSWNSANVSGLARRLSALLGVRYAHERSLADVFTERGLSLVSDDEFGKPREGAVELKYVDLSDIAPRISDPFAGIRPSTTSESRKTLFDEIVFLRKNIVSDSILRYGIQQSRYAVGAVGAQAQYQIALNLSDNPDADGQWLYMATYPEKLEAARSANALRQFLIELSVESEGIHIVEHILLRPEDFDNSVEEDDFYAFRISVMFPIWPARFHDQEFRRFAEDTVRSNCPAHIYPEIYWLEFKEMREFETLYMPWLNQTCTPSTSPEELRRTASSLEKFLRKNRTAS